MTTKKLLLGWPERDPTATTDDRFPVLELPTTLLTEKIDVLGQSGGGKTYLAMKLAELMLSIDGQIVVVDPAGVWWALRRGGAVGQTGYSVVVFGGEHGDVPLHADSATLVAELVVSRRISVVLDVSDMTEFDQSIFVTAFVSKFFELKKRNKTPVHVFLEECQEFVPEELPSKGAHAMRAVCSRSSAYEKAVAAARKRGYISEAGAQITVSAAGWRYLGRTPTRTRTDPAELREQWRQNLPDYERSLFISMTNCYPKALTREELATLSGRSITSSAFEKGVSTLKKNGLVVQQGHQLKAAAMLFGGAA